MIQKINPRNVFLPPGHYSNLVRAKCEGDILFIAGQVAYDKNGKIVGKGDFAKQTEQVFKNVKAILESQGASFSDVVKVNTYVTTYKHLRKLVELRARFLGKEPPASTSVRVVELAEPDAMVEIEAIAVIKR